MASQSGSVWAIDLGNNSLKALHLGIVEGVVTVLGLDNIRHGKVLSGSGVKQIEREELIALSLRQFVKQNDLSKSNVIISVSSQNSFARFVKLPPVEKKRIPEIVQFEAAQQIPFDISDVQWDWQIMSEPDAPQASIGIFAIKNEIATSILERFSRENIVVRYVQMAPMALYNYALYDRDNISKSESRATAIVDIGADSTDLIVCTKSTVWQRSIPMGGNAFTKAVADTFRLNFEKAEKLKRTAPMSKYARQVFQAMRPIFTDLASEIQRSLGFYTSSNPKIKISKVIALGGGTKMRGLLKYLQQALQLPVERPDAFNKLVLGPAVSAANFHENVSDFGIVYGLALQGLGLAKVKSNLLPKSIARSMAWAAKAKHFTIAACLLLAVSIMCFARTNLDRITYNNNNRVRLKINNIIKTAKQAESKLKAQQNKASDSEVIIQKVFEPLKYRDVIPLLHQIIISILPNEKNNPEQAELYTAFANNNVETILQTPRKQRKQVFVTGLSFYFADVLDAAKFGAAEFITGGVKKQFDEDEDEDDEMGVYTRTKSTKRHSRSSARDRGAARVGVDAEDQAGFVITVTGYCPYENIGELMDPPGVEDDPNRWGVITRLMHLNDIMDGNSPCELYKKTEIEHFKLEIGEVGLNAEMPPGIGILETISEKAKKTYDTDYSYVLVDPMTKEVISNIIELDEHGRRKVDRRGNVIYKANDYWFRLNFKLVWKDAPIEAEMETEDTGD